MAARIVRSRPSAPIAHSAARSAWSDEFGLLHGNVLDSPDPNQPMAQYEIPYGIVGAPAGYALACTRRFVHLSEDQCSLLKNPTILHLVVEVISLTGSFTHT